MTDTTVQLDSKERLVQKEIDSNADTAKVTDVKTEKGQLQLKLQLSSSRTFTEKVPFPENETLPTDSKLNKLLKTQQTPNSIIGNQLPIEKDGSTYSIDWQTVSETRQNTIPVHLEKFTKDIAMISLVSNTILVLSGILLFTFIGVETGPAMVDLSFITLTIIGLLNMMIGVQIEEECEEDK